MTGEARFAASEVSTDAFLGGRLSIQQPRRGYRAGVDPVLLAASVPAKPGQTILELGCGVGVASLCLHARIADLTIWGVERQAEYAALAVANAAKAGAAMTVTVADLVALPPALRSLSFDHVVANPPYFAPGDGTPADDHGREGALREDTALGQWIAVAKSRLKPRGWLKMIQATARLPDCLGALDDGFGSVAVLPIAARAGRAPNRVVIRARKGGKAPFEMRAPVVLHAGEAHERDGDDYTETARSILRDGANLPWATA